MTRNTLTDLKMAIEGTIIMSENLQSAFDALFNAKVPDFWIKSSWQSFTIGFWFTELLDRSGLRVMSRFECSAVCSLF